ncbi:T9SS type A sorting domain-containing protein [Bacteroidota bacterium]
MCRHIIYLLIILSLYQFFNPSLLAQDTSIVSLNLGNKWYYNYSYSSHSPSGSESENGVEIKEVVGDTILWDGKAYKKIYITSIVDTVTSTRLEYWGLDSSQFYHRYVNMLTQTDLDTYYDKWILNDTASYCLSVNVYQQTFWGVNRIHQKWHDCTLSGGANIDEESITAFGIGPILIAQSVYIETGGSSWSRSNTLFGVLMDGVVYGDTTTVGINWNYGQPVHFLLSQNYPNPFNPSTTIKYQIPEMSFVTIKIYDVLGKEIATLVNEEKPAGEYQVEFSPVSRIKNPASGIYFYQLHAGNYVETKKMVFLK